MKKKTFVFALIIGIVFNSFLIGCSKDHEISKNEPKVSHNVNSEEVIVENPKNDEFTQVDPFENILFVSYGRSGEGYIERFAEVTITTPDGKKEIAVDVEQPENNGALSNGDIVHVSLANNFNEDEWFNKYGIVFSRTEGNVEIHGLNAYGDPNASNGEKTTINLNDYLTIENIRNYESLDGLQVKIDYDAILEDNLKSISENIPDDVMAMMGALNCYACVNTILDYESPYEIISSSHDYSAGGKQTEIYGNLCNGDVVNLSWQENSEGIELLAQAFNAEFVFTDVEYTVSDLLPLGECDPFEDYDVMYEGTNGSGTAYGYVYIDPRKDMPIDFEVISGNNGALSNGDTITISVQHFEYTLINSWGLVPARTEMEVTVSGLE